MKVQSIYTTRTVLIESRGLNTVFLSTTHSPVYSKADTGPLKSNLWKSLLVCKKNDSPHSPFNQQCNPFVSTTSFQSITTQKGNATLFWWSYPGCRNTISSSYIGRRKRILFCNSDEIWSLVYIYHDHMMSKEYFQMRLYPNIPLWITLHSLKIHCTTIPNYQNWYWSL